MPMGKQLGVLHGLHSRDQSVDALFQLVDAALFRVVCALQIGDIVRSRSGVGRSKRNYNFVKPGGGLNFRLVQDFPSEKARF